jgi:hypothetical protein
LLLLLLAAGSAPVQAQGLKMFKCLIDGRTVYQQTACPPNAIDVKRAAEPASAPASAASPATTRAAVPAASVPAGAASNPRR